MALFATVRNPTSSNQAGRQRVRFFVACQPSREGSWCRVGEGHVLGGGGDIASGIRKGFARNWESTTRMALLAGQHRLARLPVPSVQVTLAKLWRSLQALSDDARALERVGALMADFEATTAPQLQALLEARDRTEPSSWLESWWNAAAYLAFRDCVPINSNFAMTFLSAPPVACVVRRAALLSRALLEFKTMIDDGTLPPDPQPSDQLPWTRIFGACRCPAPVCDVQRRFGAAESRHIVVVHRDAFWLVRDAQGASCKQLEAAIRCIRTSQISAATSARVGVLTYAHRDAWSTAYQALRQEEGNAALIDAIHSAAFVLCLDESRPTTLDEQARLVLHGDAASCSNRWFDKPVQLVLFANATGGINGEHSPVDGAPIARLSDWIVARELQLLGEPLESSDAPALAVEPLVFRLSSALQEHIQAAHAFARQQIDGVIMHQLRFRGFGKLVITKLGVSPDAWCQAAMQIAFFRLHGCFAPTYESASTRQFLAGRTETGRTLTPELVKFVRQLELSKTVSTPPEELRQLFVAAANAHVAYMRDAVRGVGCDRHMLAFRKLAEASGVSHALLSDPLVLSSSHWRLSTSQLVVKDVCISFGPVVPDGYGICYQVSIRNHQKQTRQLTERPLSADSPITFALFGGFLRERLSHRRVQVVC
jgi:carnitine O-acetyltransferase